MKCQLTLFLCMIALAASPAFSLDAVAQTLRDISGTLGDLGNSIYATTFTPAGNINFATVEQKLSSLKNLVNQLPNNTAISGDLIDERRSGLGKIRDTLEEYTEKLPAATEYRVNRVESGLPMTEQEALSKYLIYIGEENVNVFGKLQRTLNSWTQELINYLPDQLRRVRRNLLVSQEAFTGVLCRIKRDSTSKLGAEFQTKAEELLASIRSEAQWIIDNCTSLSCRLPIDLFEPTRSIRTHAKRAKKSTDCENEQ